MAEIINLSRVRKAKAKAEKDRSAAANRSAFGRSRVERETARKESDKLKRDLDGKKVED